MIGTTITKSLRINGSRSNRMRLLVLGRQYYHQCCGVVGSSLSSAHLQKHRTLSSSLKRRKTSSSFLVPLLSTSGKDHSSTRSGKINSRDSSGISYVPPQFVGSIGSSSIFQCRSPRENNANTNRTQCLRFLASSVGGNRQDEQNEESSTTDILSVAIVGSGPSGFYTAKYLLHEFDNTHHHHHDQNSNADEESKNLKESSSCHVDIIERLPTPFGLVRSGVAPDHPEVKNVQHDFEDVMKEYSNKLQYFGNVEVGQDISLTELLSLYDAVVLAYGCSSDKKLPSSINPNNLNGILSAREFVAWYNGHPDFVHIGEQVRECLLKHVENPNDDNQNEVRQANVVVIGHGNVALDCARILAKGCAPAALPKGQDNATGTTVGNGDLFNKTDIASHCINILGAGASKVTIVGRRGHIQGAFTIKELRELTKLQKEGHGASFTIYQQEMELGMTESSQRELQRPKERIDKLLSKQLLSKKSPQEIIAMADAPKQVILRFLLNPFKVKGDKNMVSSVVCERTKLVGEPFQQKAIGAGVMEQLPADMVLVSIGYKGEPVQGNNTDDISLNEQIFDFESGTYRNHHGKVVDVSDDGASNVGLYVSGWLKRGPTGIIGTNISDARDTVATILKDYQDGLIGKTAYEKQQAKGRHGFKSLLKERKVNVVDWDQYQMIDEWEMSDEHKRRSLEQPREKLTSIHDMLEIASTKK